MSQGTPQIKHRVDGRRDYVEAIQLRQGIDEGDYFSKSEDFDQNSGGTLPSWLAKQDTSAAGAPTVDFVDDAHGGEFELTLAATDEVESLTMYQADALNLDVAKNPTVEVRAKLNTSGASPSATGRCVIGIASARNATLDSIVTHAWFRIEAASFNLVVEGDDGTTDTDDQATGRVWSDNAYARFKISIQDPDNDGNTIAVFEVDLEDGAGWVSATSVAINAATGNLQPFIEIQKDSGTDTDSLVIDYIKKSSER